MLPAPTDLIAANPGLRVLLPLGFHPLAAGSPAIDAAGAVCASTDQRGIHRPQGAACDVGALEYSTGGIVPAYVFAVEGTPQTVLPTELATTPLAAYRARPPGCRGGWRDRDFLRSDKRAQRSFPNGGINTTTALTDFEGVARTAYSANALYGDYSVAAGVVGLPGIAQFQLRNGPSVKTHTAQNDDDLPGYFLCDEADATCTEGGNLHADAAHKSALGTVWFYADRFSRNSVDDAGMTVVSSVHYKFNYDNAFWNGAQMVYGDASSWPLADDVVGHELTHGVTQYELALFYYYQSGAINESISDVFGELLDQTNGLGTDTPGVKWQIGEDVTGGSAPGPFRSMSNPPAYGGMPVSIDPDHPTSGDPDRINTANYYIGPYDNGGVHENSGVNNKAAFLMVDGGTFNSKTVSPLGIDKTLAIYYEAQVNLLTSGSDYGDLYYVLPQACLNLVDGTTGITSADCAEVQDAVDATAMNAQPSSDSGFNTEAYLCSGSLVPANLFYDTMEAGSANWTLSAPHWQWDSPYEPRAHSGVHYLYADDLPDEVADVSATMNTGVLLPANALLHFAHAYDFEYYIGDPNWYDGGVLEYSTNNGNTWNDAGGLFSYNGYDHQIFTYPSGYEYDNNPLHGRSAFTGTSHGYISSRLNLAGLAGQTAKFRWRMGLDYIGANMGWWLDDVRIYTCVPPSPVQISGNAGAAGATMTYTGGSTSANASGDYSFTVPYNWSGTVTPSLADHVFSPTSRTYTNQVANATAQDYLATIDFADVPVAGKEWMEPWVVAFYNAGITTGCGANPLRYCPENPVTRAAMAVFVLRAIEGPSYVPPGQRSHLLGPARGGQGVDGTVGERVLCPGHHNRVRSEPIALLPGEPGDARRPWRSSCSGRSKAHRMCHRQPRTRSRTCPWQARSGWSPGWTSSIPAASPPDAARAR